MNQLIQQNHIIEMSPATTELFAYLTSLICVSHIVEADRGRNKIAITIKVKQFVPFSLSKRSLVSLET